ncbi:DUF6408 family protein [Streptomyces griseocarneus]|nr:DUF6408 family protein [Streptomyces griseocarneus]MBZ6472480.1 hypothetical protein [Streptomyces griseocarneus]GHG45410.1 hypothetical protein GCM10018779_01320 [Streptomyces griseocarneus]
MNPVEYESARRTRIRRILIDIATSTVSNLLATALASAARLLF